jgi:queuine tRNA-ribosyltransferase
MDEFNRGENPNALFGIVQGGMFENLRDESLAKLEEIDFPGRPSAACRWANRRKT